MSSESAHFHFLIERGRFVEAEAVLRSSLAKDPDNAGLHMNLSRLLCRMDRPKESEEAALRAIGLEPEWGTPHEILAEALLASSNLKGAEQAVNQAIAIDGDDADRRGILARIHHQRQRPEVSLEHATAGLAIDPDHDTCRFFRTIALGELGRHEEADRAALSLLSDDPENSTNHSARGWILLDRNAVPEARMHFQEALRLDPDNEDARMGIARCLQQGNPLLGWFLRLIIRVGKVPFPKAIVLILVFGFVLPGYLKGKGQPEILRMAGLVIGTAFMLFFYVSMVARPLFDGILSLSREGRMALGSHESRAVRWCYLPLLAGFVCLGLWIANGSKSVPFAGIGWLATAELVHQGFCNRHAWVRRRMLGIAAVAFGASLWLSAGPSLVLKPLGRQIVAELSVRVEKKNLERLKTLPDRLQQFLRLRNRAFIYPALVLFLVASYSDEIAAVLQRRAPDEPT